MRLFSNVSKVDVLLKNELETKFIQLQHLQSRGCMFLKFQTLRKLLYCEGTQSFCLWVYLSNRDRRQTFSTQCVHGKRGKAGQGLPRINVSPV